MYHLLQSQPLNVFSLPYMGRVQLLTYFRAVQLFGKLFYMGLYSSSVSYFIWGCTALRQVILYGAVQLFGSYFIWGCTALRQVILYGAVQLFGSYFIWDCTALR